MGVLSKLQIEGLNKVVDEITKCKNPEEARVIRMTKNAVAVFENTEKAAVSLRGLLLDLVGWTISLEAMVETLNDSNKIPECNKKIVLNDILDIEIII